MRMQLSFILMVLMSLPLTSLAGGNDSELQIKQIREVFKEVREREPSLIRSENLIEGYAPEGTGVTIFQEKDGTIRKVIAEHLGETGRWREDYYFDTEQQLRFVYRENDRYNAHIMESVTEGTQISVVETTEERFYLSKGKLIRWLDNEKREVMASDTEYDKNANYFMKFVHDVVKLLDKQK